MHDIRIKFKIIFKITHCAPSMICKTDIINYIKKYKYRFEMEGNQYLCLVCGDEKQVLSTFIFKSLLGTYIKQYRHISIEKNQCKT